MHFPHINWTWDVSAGQIISLFTMLGGLYQINRRSRKRTEESFQALSAKFGMYGGAILRELQPKKGSGDPKAHTEPLPFKPE
jgi:hypothetical protein